MVNSLGGAPIGVPPSHLSDDDEALKKVRGFVPSPVWRDPYPTTLVFVTRPALPEGGSWGLAGAASHAAAVNEISADEDTSYIQSGSVTSVQEDMTLPNLNTLPLNATGYVVIRVREAGGSTDQLTIAIAVLPLGTGGPIVVWTLNGTGHGSNPQIGASYASFRLPLTPAQYTAVRTSGGATLRLINTSHAGGVFNVTQAYLAAEK